MTEGKIILTDEPLKSPDQDRLDFSPFAERIANIIKNMQLKDSIVFAVYGKWGSGKTTFLNFLTYYLEDSDSISIVKFNPWWFSGKEDLIQQFLYNLKLTWDKSSRLKDIAKKLESYLDALGEIPTVGWIAKIGVKFRRASQKSIGEIKEEIIKQLTTIDGKIVVLMDDIDRLTAKEIRELFTIVKSIADFPNTVYILAVDKEVAVRALEKVQEGKGEDYLGKIVQVQIELPFVDKISIRKMLFEELDAVLSGTPNELFDSTYWGNVYWEGIDPFINTVRDVKRLTNAIKVTYPAVKGEVNAVDFIAIETVRVFCPEVYKVVKNNPDMFCGHSEGSLYASQDSEVLKQFHQKWSSKLPEEFKNFEENIKDLLKRLFPKLERVFGNTYYGPEWEQEWRKKCRVCSRDMFPRFFSFSVPPDDISRNEMEAILRSLDNKETFGELLKGLATKIRSDGSTKLSVFLERMIDYTPEFPQEYIPIVVETFFDIGDEFIIPEDEDKGFFIGWRNDIGMRRIIWQLLRKYDDKNRRFEILKDAFENGQAISMMVVELISFWQQHGKYGGAKKSDEDILFDEEHLKKFQEIVLEKIKKAAREKRLLNTPFLPNVLHAWKKWGMEDEVKDWVSEMIASDEKLPIFLSKFLQKTTSVGLTDRVVTIQWRLNPNWLKDFIDLDTLEKRCKEVLSSKSIVARLDDKQKLTIKQFLKEKRLLDEGKNPDDPFFSEELEKDD